MWVTLFTVFDLEIFRALSYQTWFPSPSSLAAVSCVSSGGGGRRGPCSSRPCHRSSRRGRGDTWTASPPHLNTELKKKLRERKKRREIPEPDDSLSLSTLICWWFSFASDVTWLIFNFDLFSDGDGDLFFLFWLNICWESESESVYEVARNSL